VLTGDFETWEADREFDAVTAFTAYHWLDAETRFERSARVLRPGGALAVVETRHVLPPDGDPFFAAVQEDYDAVHPRPDNRPPPPPQEIEDLTAAFDASRCFEPARAGPLPLGRRLTRPRSTSPCSKRTRGHRALAEAERNRLYELIRARIGDGTVRKTYLATLTSASKMG